MLADPAPSTLADPWRQRDLAVLWQSAASQRALADPLPPLPIARGEGPWLIDHDGRRYLDAVSSGGNTLFGHAPPRIGAALAAQAAQLDHALLAGFSPAPAILLAERLLALAPRQAGRAPLARVLFGDSGATAVDAALAMTAQYFRTRDEPHRTRFVALENGAHGGLPGALAADALLAPSPDAYLAAPGQTAAQRAHAAADALATLFDQHPGEIGAVIVEPRLQCAGGMRVHDPVYLQRARALCDANGAFLIADERATGFGRTGTLFACEQAGVMPDLLCLSGGLTGGVLPLSAVLATQALHEAVAADPHAPRVLHAQAGGHPLACAAALATLDMFANEDVIARNRSTAEVMRTLAAPFHDHPCVADVRQAGMVVAFELTRGGDRRTPFPPEARIGLQVGNAALKRGVLLRPLGDVLYWMPPYCMEDDHLDLLAQTTLAAIEEAIACA